jgi:transcriptional regulator with XRE-family HTH domain
MTKQVVANIGKAIHWKRKESGKNQAEFAKFIGISEALLSLLERGGRRDIRIGTAVKIANGMNLDLCTLLNWKNPHNVP